MQSFDMEGKVVVITGGAGLLGEKHAEAIAEFGGIPVLLDINQNLGEKKALEISKKYEIECKFKLCDVKNEPEILNVRDYLLNKYGRIDALINNAAIDPKVGKNNEENLSRLENFSVNQWNLELSVGLTGAMLCSKIFGHHMSKKGKGVILNISSDLGLIAPDHRLYKKEGIPDENQPVKPVTYSVLKHGIIGLTKYISTYWANKGVRCNALCPGGVYNNQAEDFIQKISDLIPMGRMADNSEYKSAVVFLVSDASSYMNGATVVIDGGRSVW